MIVVVSDNFIKEGKAESLIPAYRKVMEYTRKQPGCIYYEAFLSTDDPNTFVFFEKWASEEDLNVHLEDQVFNDMYKEIEDCFSADESLKKYKTIL